MDKGLTQPLVTACPPRTACHPVTCCHPEEGVLFPTKDLCTSRQRRCCQQRAQILPSQKQRPQDDKTGRGRTDLCARVRAADVLRACHQCALSVSRVKVGCHKKADSCCGNDNAATDVTVPTADNPHPSNPLSRPDEADAVRDTRPVRSRGDGGIRAARLNTRS